MASAVIRRGTHYIAQAQHTDGSFDIVCWPQKRTVAPPSVTLDLHALLLDTLHTADDPSLQQVTPKLANFLASKLRSLVQRDAFATVDTHALFHCLASLYEYDSRLIKPAMLAAAVRLLVDMETAPGGPYRNALDPATSTPDPETNASISRFLHYIGGPFPKLTEYVARHAGVRSRYYTRAWPSRLQQALAVDASSNNAAHPSATTSSSGPGTQLLDGSWPVEYLYKDPHSQSPKVYGSAALTTAHMLAKLAPPKQPTSTKSDLYKQREATIAAARRIAGQLSPLIAPTMAERVDKIVRADTTREISSFAAWFAAALRPECTTPQQTLQALDTANIYNWIAYTIYDDFLDDEGKPRLLPAANVALRTAVTLFTQAVPDAAFAKLVSETFNTVDAANAWEIANCRFAVGNDTIDIGALPDYADLHYLHDRSLSHSLPIMGTLAAADLPLHGKGVAAIRQACMHYLVVRQLSDDLHDWKEDLRAGHISYVVTRLLADAGVLPGIHPFEALLPWLEQTYLQQTMPAICRHIHDRATLAKQLLQQSKLVAEHNAISQLVDRLADMASRMLAEQAEAHAFLVAYHGSTTPKT